ncbi:hypothetical protein LSAT2_002574 [Lamellibrachia satsuma]|nr:hypothetical protein LSAT2_002574 [Lamellibrachia satsuma]
MTEYYNQKSKDRCFNPGDAIYVKNHIQSAPKWIPAVLQEKRNNVKISGRADGRYLRRLSDHVRRRHAVATDYLVEQKVQASGIVHRTPLLTAGVAKRCHSGFESHRDATKEASCHTITVEDAGQQEANR